MNRIAIDNNIHCETEYAALKKVLVAKPSYMKITEVINETQKHYIENNIDVPLAVQQHENFVDVLQQNLVEVAELPADPVLHEQVFTRDIGFTINDQLFVGSMSEMVRQEETDVLKDWLKANALPYEDGLPSSIEGGDVVTDGSTIWIGISGRTSHKAIVELQERLPDHTVEPLQLRKDILHLDCVFNILGEQTALVYTPAFSRRGLAKIKARFNVIPVTKEEQFHMGPNVLSIGDNKVISLPQNERLNRVMQRKGFNVVPVNFSEIIKSGGSFRCCTLPLQREMENDHNEPGIN
ncbi:dimethylarginine dimethylaminohydrolase family protein [Thalassobacillus hwangdonensis]|uniref:Dimethylarginine dimethylaminohydrolase family protein n=1 Tax=Thalassobacillus hwangdonensis TaxID=546108 RepID=A0ABW3L4S8_9BACI